jgi:uncharacterized protein YlxW (UPF0749 family)
MKTKNSSGSGFSPRVSALLATAASLDSGVMAAAAKELKAAQEKEAQAKALHLLSEMDNALQHRVTQLRNIRKQEKAYLADLKKFDAAMEQFMKDGDTEAFNKNYGINFFRVG